ncbi:hypothetical protein BASA82_000414 [Batrachochytrium salamandrivorans]|nr:hypothetical protein BASA82_000414 [Batrachochytrium salamandrivorans]
MCSAKNESDGGFTYSSSCIEWGCTSRKLWNSSYGQWWFGMGVNDFDQSFSTPFTWDLRRGATGAMVACVVRGWNQDVCRQSANAYIQIFERARQAETDAEVLTWLEEKLSVDTKNDRFYETEESKPLPADSIPDFQAAIDAYLFHGVPALMLYPPGEFWEVKSVARRLGKESEQGKRAVDAERGAYPYANPFFGWTNFEGHAFIIQEMSKHAKSIKIEFLTASEYIDYSQLCGRALAFYHFKMTCGTPTCGLKDRSDVDVETWEAVSDYIRSMAYPNFVIK